MYRWLQRLFCIVCMYGFVSGGVHALDPIVGWEVPNMSTPGYVPFVGPQGIDVDGMGNVYVSDRYRHQVFKLNTEYEIEGIWGQEGSEAGEFSFPDGVYVDDEGERVYIADSGNGRVQVFDLEGAFLSEWTGIDSPHDIASYGGNVYVLCSGRTIAKYSEGGELMDTYSVEEYIGYAMDMDSSGNFYALCDQDYVCKYDLSGGFVTSWGGLGNLDGQMNDAVGLEVVREGAVDRVYVTDLDNHRVQVFDTSGNFVAKWGGYDPLDDYSGPGKFDKPRGIASDDGGYIYVAEGGYLSSGEGNKRVQVFTSGGVFVDAVGLASFHDVGVDGFGNSYVGDDTCSRILKFDSEGMYEKGVVVDNLSGFGVSDDGQLCVVDKENYEVRLYDSDLEYLGSFGNVGVDAGKIAYLIDCAFDNDGYIYVSDGYTGGVFDDFVRIQKFNSSGEYLGVYGEYGDGEGQFRYPSGIDIDEDGNVYVVDSSNLRVSKFNSSGEFVTSWGSYGSEDGQFKSPDEISVSPDGTVWVVDSGNYRIQHFSSAGDFLGSYGSEGTGEGQFIFPSGISFREDGSFVVTDSGNHRMVSYVFDVSSPEVLLVSLDIPSVPGVSFLVTGRAVDEMGLVSGVWYQVDGVDGEWVTCVALDGLYDESEEDFSCAVPGLSEGSHTLYFRTEDGMGNETVSGSEYAEVVEVDSVEEVVDVDEVDTGEDGEVEEGLAETGEGVVSGLMCVIAVVVVWVGSKYGVLVSRFGIF